MKETTKHSTDPAAPPVEGIDPNLVIHKVFWYQKAALWPASLLVRLWGRTLRVRFEEDAKRLLIGADSPVLYVFWHNHILLAAATRRILKRPFPMAAMSSASKDGAWAAALFSIFGLTAIRGSTHRRGSQAIRAMLKAHEIGFDLCITPDGSRGPCYHLRPGTVFLSQKANAPLLLCGATFHKAWRLKSWDRFYLPKPFSRIDVRVERVEPEELAECPDTESARQFLEKRLRGLVPE